MAQENFLNQKSRILFFTTLAAFCLTGLLFSLKELSVINESLQQDSLLANARQIYQSNPADPRILELLERASFNKKVFLARDNFILGKAYLQKGLLSQAQSALTKSLLQDPQNKETRISWLVVRLAINPSQELTSANQSLLKQTFSSLEQVTALQNEIGKKLELGKLLLQKGEPGLAAFEFAQIIKEQPLYPAGFLYLGLAKMEQKKLAEARENLWRAFRLDPNNNEVINFLLNLKENVLSNKDKEELRAKNQKLATFM